MTLSGSVSGTSWAELMKRARDVAAAYYGTTCVEAQLSDEAVEDIERTADGSIDTLTFSARFTADEQHRIEAPVYGPPKCRDCGHQFWPGEEGTR